MPMPKRMRKTRSSRGVSVARTRWLISASWTGLHFPQEELRFVLDETTLRMSLLHPRLVFQERLVLRNFQDPYTLSSGM